MSTPTERANRLRLIPQDLARELKQEHCAGARLFANRYELIASMKLPANPVVTEVGVGVGDFSAFIFEQLRPSHFHAFDIFRMHELDEFWGVPRKQVFGDLTHEQFFRQRFADQTDRLTVYEGDSRETLERLPDQSQDLIYIDANHDLEPVRAEAAIAMRKIKSGGVIVFNDYTSYDQYLGIPYGVVQAVNEVLQSGNWYVVGFALQPSMFCDIAIRRRPLARARRWVRRYV